MRQRRAAFTIVELLIVIVVIGVLATITIFAFGSWRQRTAETEVKNDITNVVAAMKSARNWGNGYPIFSDGTIFDGANTTKSVYTPSSNVLITYFHGDATKYCMNIQSKVIASVYYYVDTTSGNTNPAKGVCS